MEPPLATEFDDLDDMPTVPGVTIVPAWVLDPDAEGNALLEDPTSWDEDDTKRFRLVE